MVDKQTPPANSPFGAYVSSTRGSDHLGFGGEDDILYRKKMPKTMHWSVPWADLMMTMFILFAIMYIYHSSSRDVLPGKESEVTIGTRSEPSADVTVDDAGHHTEGQKESIADIYDRSRQTVRANDLESFASVDLLPDKAVRIILTGDLLFDAGQADLKPEAKRSLERIANVIRESSYMINVVGHTDDVPIHSESFPTNWELSAVRASKVARFLIEEMGIQGERLYITGHSYHQPVSSNDSAIYRAANRRVEIIITKEKPYGSPNVTESLSGLDLSEDNWRSKTDTWPRNTFQ